MSRTKEFIKNAVGDPTLYFKNPKDVTCNQEISNDDKIKILKSWKDICKKEKVAEYEGMTVIPDNRLPEINKEIRVISKLDNQSTIVN